MQRLLTITIQSKKPNKYLINNYEKSKTFLNLCITSNIKNFIYSSTASIYGNNKKKVKEDEKPRPLSPYAKSKLNLEKFFLRKKKKLISLFLDILMLVELRKS